MPEDVSVGLESDHIESIIVADLRDGGLDHGFRKSLSMAPEFRGNQIPRFGRPVFRPLVATRTDGVRHQRGVDRRSQSAPVGVVELAYVPVCLFETGAALPQGPILLSLVVHSRCPVVVSPHLRIL